MRIILLPDQVYEYALFMLKEYVHGPIEPEELAPAGALWECLKSAREIKDESLIGAPRIDPDGKLCIPINANIQAEVEMGESEPLEDSVE